MPFCPNCRSEYRAGFTTCPPCDGIALVDEIPTVEALEVADLSQTSPVGFASSSDVSREVEVEGRAVDLLRVYFLPQASEIEQTLMEARIPAAILPVDIAFSDEAPQRFEVRVKSDDRLRAEDLLRKVFAAHVEAEGVEGPISGGDAETCPACGAHVPLDVEECPECGLNVGGA